MLFSSSQGLHREFRLLARKAYGAGDVDVTAGRVDSYSAASLRLQVPKEWRRISRLKKMMTRLYRLPTINGPPVDGEADLYEGGNVEDLIEERSEADEVDAGRMHEEEDNARNEALNSDLSSKAFPACI